MVASGLDESMALPTACIKWVFPIPTPPYIKRGLYLVPGFWAIAWQAAWASSLPAPTTKLSNV